MTYFWLCLSALAAGGVNAIAGGGTLLTFPALTAVILPVFANGTSTVSLLPGSVAGAWGFRRELTGCRRWILLLFPPSLAGGAVGASLVEADSFRMLIPWLILTASLLFIIQPTVARYVKLRHAVGPPSLAITAGIVIVQFLIAIYGGYFGAGIGILMLSSLSFLNLANIHQINGLKNILALGINGMAAIVFITKQEVVWDYAPAMAIASIIGGYSAARISLLLRPAWIRWLVIAIGLSLSVFYYVRG